jgi:mannosyltransferase
MAAFLIWRSLGTVAKAYMPATLVATTKNAQKLIVVSEASAADLRRLFPWTRHKIVVARHGLPSDVRKAALDPGVGTNQTEGPFRLLFLDGGNPRKRLDLCLQVLEKRNWRNVRLRVTGNPELCRLQIQRVLGRVPEQIELVGRLPRPDLLHSLAESDLLLYPSDFEGFGFPLIEAMAFGTSVVAFPGGAEKEVGGEFAQFASEPSADSLSQALDQALERCRDPAWRRAVARHALSFTWDDSVAIHQLILGELAET